MPYETKFYERERLYREVWSRPLKDVAPEYNLSGTGLSKVCKKLHVPTPARGYWAKKAAGHDVRPVPLPALAPGQLTQYQVERWVRPTLPPAEAAFRARPEFQPQLLSTPPFAVKVSATLAKPHRLVALTKERLLKATPDYHNGILSSGRGTTFEVTVSKGLVSRSVRILDALAKAVEKAGHRILQGDEFYDGKVTRLVIDRFEVLLILKERLSRVPHVATGKEIVPREWDLVPNGSLRLSVAPTTVYDRKETWEDSPGSLLESQLDAVFLSILNVAPRARAILAEREERNRLEGLAEEQRRRAEALRQEERRLEALVVEEAQKWEQVARVRRFVEFLRGEATRANVSVEPGSPAAVWFERATRVAAQLDPAPKLVDQWLRPRSAGEAPEAG